MKITSKGQVTIPLAIRERAGFLPNSEVNFEVRGNTVVLCKAKEKKSRGKRIVEQLRGRGTVRMNTDEIMALTRGD
jgi:AbrB family looped-hinge helix DNA binding protein